MAMMPMAIILLFAILLAGGVSSAESSYIEYNTTQRIVPGKINVHLVPHSHDDVGWLKTVDQYYFGGNNSIRGACVQNVLDSVISALFDDKNRKFIYVEMAFFQRWWRQQSNAKKIKVKELVNSGQLEFINGGMCMHDEATPHYIDLIDQTTLGHKYIKDEFNQIPRVGWQIDPFGHSAVQAYLLGAELGFDSLFFARIDYQDRAKRLKEKTLEVVWQGSKSLGSSSQIFTGIFPRHYDPPDGFTFEINDVSPPIQDDVLLFDYNVQERVNDFIAAALAQANVTRTNHIMWAMGTDFRYQYANSWFRQMDKFIHYVNQDGRINALYSTPSIYTDAKYTENVQWPLKTDDFFPYADKPNAYWTGYFTSRPAFKGYVRVLSAYYLAARQLEFFKGRSASGPNTDALADALAIAQHHDAVSGTERQHVAADYALRLSIGYKEAEKVVASSLAFLADSRSSTEQKNSVTSFEQCPLLNISFCPPSEAALSSGKSLVIVIYNSLGWKREETIRIPVSSERIVIKDSEGREIESQLIPLSNSTLRTRSQYIKAYLGKKPRETAKYWVAFSVSVPSLGFSTYIVATTKETDGRSPTISTMHTYEASENNTIEVGQGSLKLLYSADKGKLTRYVNTRNSVTAFAEQSYGYYSGNDGTDKDPQASGAYVFRPNGTFSIKSENQTPLTVVRGPLLDEVHQQLNSWISQVTRVYKGKEHAEVEFSIGPIPVNDGIGKEIITQITTTMRTNKTFYTDSNGRDFIKRIRDFRKDWDLQVNQPIAGNYYPVNLGIYVQDDSTELSVLVDRSVGASSLADGQIELMLHRRLIHDDIRGVGEVLNETVCVSEGCDGLTILGKFYLRIDHIGEGAKWRRTVGQEIYSPLLLAFSEQDGNDWMSSHIPTFSGIDPSYSLPDNIAIITLQELENGKVLLRLAHLFETGEDKEYSVMASVELKKLFPNKKIKKVTEMSLSANQERGEMEKRRLAWKVEGGGGESKVVRGGAVDPAKLLVELAPMEIRTFLIDVDYIQLCNSLSLLPSAKVIHSHFDGCYNQIFINLLSYMGFSVALVTLKLVENTSTAFGLQIKDKTEEITREEDDDDIDLLEEDIVRTSVNGIPAIGFSNRVNQLLIKDMELTVVIKLLGRKIGYATLQNKIHSLWKPSQPFRLMDIENGYYLAKFQNVGNFERVLSLGPWIVYGQYLTVQPWSIEFNPSKPYPNMVMAWIRLPGLPGHIFARMTVYVNLGKALTSKVLINGIPQRIEYEHLPTACFSCGHYGHKQDICPKSGLFNNHRKKASREKKQFRKIDLIQEKTTLQTTPVTIDLGCSSKNTTGDG
ncbi:hypothetical protein CXB51_024080 [Gossypium anomalum]|uniref:alpha-mannosidase n=1 Tax=Gossypium anomalum TaxID=47600 RepID=A0A8J5Y5I7_9ROSI|nr:hypothetical protein CXB51_024080 [Gossypium anomalum]